MTERKTAAALIIGNELLSGKIADQNLVVLARTLNGIGMRLARVVVVRDDLPTITAEVRGLSASHDTLFTSGGVGPTHDDLTIDGVARAPKGARLVQSKEPSWPTIVIQNTWVLPGVPEIFAAKMPLVVAELGGAAAAVSRVVYTNLDEGNLKPLLDKVVADHPEVEIGSYPQWRHSRYKVQVTFDCVDAERVDRAQADLELLMPEGALVETEED
ncbi:MAG: competence/damage-inducible protein A [Deltaproteobacteria bacterium]|nr:competence/damage-inducible protein A [Deltaproteobacteria bacterium]